MSGLPSDISAALRASEHSSAIAGLDIRWLPTVTSTMDVVAGLATAGAPGVVVVGADEQTSGRGRRGHTWQSPPGAGLYFSMLWRPALAASALPLLTLAAGLGVHRGLAASTGLSADLKWPNDILVGRRKLAGILAEGVGLGSPNPAVVVGVGVNLQEAAYPSDVAARATSLAGELGRLVDRGAVFSAILVGLVESLAEVERDRNDILRAWRASASSIVGSPVEWTDRTGPRRGLTAGIDEVGALLVQTDGRVERIIAGEVRWLKDWRQPATRNQGPATDSAVSDRSTD